MNCPRCSVNTLDPITGRCELCGYSFVAGVVTESADEIGELAAKQLSHEFQLGDVIGRGDGSLVLRATERASQRTLLLKVILRRTVEPDGAESFRELMATLSALDHPHLAPILRHGSTDSLLWSAIEDRGSESLAAMRRRGPLDLRAVRRLLAQLVAAIDYLHRRGIVHGAVKAENVLVDRAGWVALTDANFVRPRWRRVSDPGTPSAASAASAGMEPWVSPEERARGERLPAADQYALGVLTASLLVGGDPDAPAALLERMDPALPPFVREAIARAIAESPMRRFPSVSDFLLALEGDAPAGLSTPHFGQKANFDVLTVRDWTPPPDPRRTLRRVLTGVGVVALVAVVVAVLPVIRDIVAPPVVAPTRVGTGTLGSPATTAPPRPVPPPSSQVAPPPARERAATAAGAERTVPAPDTPPDAAAGTPAGEARPPAEAAARPPAEAAARPPAEAAARPPAAAATARLFINASPWGELRIDGVLIGNTPRANLPITAGRHLLRISRDGFTTWERRIVVADGETLRITDIVLEPVRP